MDDSRTYTRLVCDTIFKRNFASILISKIVKLYYVLFSHPLNLLKFSGNIPIKEMREYKNTSFKREQDKANTLG